MLLHFPSAVHLERVTPKQAAAAAATAVAAVGLLVFMMMRKRISPEELELRRRTFLGEAGRIIDGSIVGIDDETEDTTPDGSLDAVTPLELERHAAPRVLIYSYRIAGVTYECAQDVSSLADKVRHVRLDLPVQVRYNPHNPGDSIIVCEGWTGLRHDRIPAQTQDEFLRD